ncbi:ribokinase [Canibacter sp. lx-45]|uniref:ribokinase n=1 Tax=Canibacter zhuwentaonis TaxID=2837491 RepID=UPI001BDD14CF|nr:ribokinase [Canibacter zhuwentaonis]MBT1035963.1 ribokinase [Canibacter zhuwentaonis]
MTTTSKKGVLVIGSASADLTVFSDAAPAPGETILGRQFTLMLGGKGANQAVAVSKADTPSYFVGAVGADEFGTLVSDGLKSAQVSTSYLATTAADHTGVAHIRVDSTGENNIVVVPGANAALTTAQIDKAIDELKNSCSVMLIQLEIPLEIVAHAIASAHSARIRVILDPAPATQLPKDIWRMLDTVTPNETEAQILTGIRVTDAASAVTAGEWFISRGVKNALITLAAAGCVLVTEQGSSLHEPFRVTAVDTTAAGDTFAGYLASSLASGADFVNALRRANAAGALAVTKKGASASIPTDSEVAAFLALLKVTAKVDN